tara:strand:- start:327 stop:1370 length:1044 start_codon:yes stop_codon:yes gene_type:complete
MVIISEYIVNICLLGGGLLLLKIAEAYANNNNIGNINIITSERHYKEEINIDIFFDTEYKRISENNNNNVLDLKIVKDLDSPFFEEIAKDSQLLISFGSAWMFKKKHIDYCKNLINVHCTNLPQWRGGGFPSWMILAGINYSSITIHKIDEGIDTGNIIYTKKFFFPPGCKTPLDYKNHIHELSYTCLNKFINDFVSNANIINEIVQQEDFSSYFPRLNSDIHACIDWTWNSNDLIKFIDAFDDPYSGAFTNISGKTERIYLKKAYVVEGECNYHPFQAGIVFRKEENGIYICTNGGAIYCQSVLNFNGNNVIDNISTGDRLYSKYDDLEKARSTKTIYTSKGRINR